MQPASARLSLETCFYVRMADFAHGALYNAPAAFMEIVQRDPIFYPHADGPVGPHVANETAGSRR